MYFGSKRINFTVVIITYHIQRLNLVINVDFPEDKNIYLLYEKLGMC